VTGTATLTELIPASASRARASLVATAATMGGLGLGPLIAGLFARYAPHPTVLVFEVYLAVLAAAGVCLFLVPETVSPRHRPTVRFAGLGIPERGRGRVRRRRRGRVRRLLPARARQHPEGPVSPCNGCRCLIGAAQCVHSFPAAST
jgi:MFS family permease